MKKKTKILISVLVILLLAGAATGLGLKTYHDRLVQEELDRQAKMLEDTRKDMVALTSSIPVVDVILIPDPILNPLTGIEGYNEDAVGKRPVAVVVENSPDARPQWGIDDPEKAPDIILEGEVEGGITRTLWFYADYTALPDQIGPIRSARPPFIRFSELFDAIFIHWGMSATGGGYVGADSVFWEDGVDHINEMSYGNGALFSRDYSRPVSSEHTGVLFGAGVEGALKDYGFRTEVDEDAFSTFTFNEEPKKAGKTTCNTLDMGISSISFTHSWTYDKKDECYHCSDYATDVSRKNLLVLFDSTGYIPKANYHGTGSTVVYCDYGLYGGTGVYASLGGMADITWAIEEGKLVIRDEEGKEIVGLNPGKTWIGWASSNYGGWAQAS